LLEPALDRRLFGFTGIVMPARAAGTRRSLFIVFLIFAAATFVVSLVRRG
jgi:uncharacterized membrane protein YtjA (UPF0391 family)